MKKNIILESDSFHAEKLSAWLDETRFHQMYNIFILTRPERKERFQRELSNFKELQFISYHNCFEHKSDTPIELIAYKEFIDQFFNDNQTARFLDREGYFPHYGIGVQNAFAYYTDVAFNLLSFLKDKQIEALYFRNTPHEFVEHLMGRATEFLGINLYTSEQLIFPWIYTLRKGIGKHRKWLYNDETFESKSKIQAQVSQYVQKLTGHYEDAIPLYEKNRKGRGVFKHYNPLKFPSHLIKSPHKFWCMTRNFLYYKKHSQEIDYKNTDYFLFFLHYQPERSTLPEGYGFEDQFFAIKILSKMLPKGTKLVVKEHPSMFIRGSEFKIRSIYNYKSILNLPNVELCKMHMDNFKLMDNALAVSTITGTVALEGYVRRKPVILFGRCVLNLKGVHSYNNIESLQQFVYEIVHQKIHIEQVEDNLVELCSSGSFSGLDEEYPVLDLFPIRKYRTNAHLKSLTVLLDRLCDDN